MTGLLFCLIVPATAQSGSKPNIILFLVDDMGWQDTSVPFWSATTPLNRRYHTPNMERLAAAGIKFTNAYAMPVCTPTRISIITGVNAARHRVTQWTSPYRDRSTDYPDKIMVPVPWNINGLSPTPGIPATFVGTPLPQLLRDNGYYTVHSGKAHFASADTPGSNPLNLGFQVNIAGSEIGHPASYSGKENFDHPRDGKPNRNAVPGLEAYHGKDVHLTDVLTTEALKAISKPIAAKQPFFLYLAHYAVHTPLQADERFAPKYREAGLDSTEAAYASLVEGMDKSLGEILDFIAEQKIADNTIIIFTSDNGGLSRVPPRGGDQSDIHNLPLRSGKGSVYEGGIRVPLIVLWPGKTKAATVSEQPVVAEDLFPTILELAGVKSPKVKQVIDGKSYAQSLTGSNRIDTSRVILYHHPNRWIADEGQLTAWAGAVRRGDWKLLYDYQRGTLELYNLRNDIGEQNNLLSIRPEKARELARLFTEELKRTNAQMPSFADGRKVPFPNEILQHQKK
ncbi:sulfatase [Chryseolinea sp. T2]|uniref:sulfatase n=1 Tax=Chryseolinea sp. T2 TaxID=3129255 RepID=UPI0030778CB4